MQPTKFDLAINLKTAKALGFDGRANNRACYRRRGDRMRKLCAGAQASVTRRRFIAVAVGAAAWSWMARAQPATKAAQIGLLYPGFEAVTVTRIAALREGTRAVGYASSRPSRDPGARFGGGDPSRLEGLAAGSSSRAKSGGNRRHQPVGAPIGKVGDFDYSDYRQRSRKRSGLKPLCNQPRAPRRQHHRCVFGFSGFWHEMAGTAEGGHSNPF